MGLTFRRTFVSRAWLPLAAALALHSSPAPAQTVPTFAVELTMGKAPHTLKHGERWFKQGSRAGRLGVALAVGPKSRLRPVLLVETGGFGGHITDDCVFAPDGSCRKNFPQIGGRGFGFGLRYAVSQRGLMGVGVGISPYHMKARFAEIDASWRVFPHTSVVGEWRYMTFPWDSRRLWIRPLTGGVRLHF